MRSACTVFWQDTLVIIEGSYPGYARGKVHFVAIQQRCAASPWQRLLRRQCDAFVGRCVNEHARCDNGRDTLATAAASANISLRKYIILHNRVFMLYQK